MDQWLQIQDSEEGNKKKEKKGKENKSENEMPGHCKIKIQRGGGC